MSTKKLSVIIAGAGLGGLACAIALRRAGHEVTVYEKHTVSHEVGQGIGLWPNGGRILRHLGLDFEKARTTGMKSTTMVRADNLEQIRSIADLTVFEKVFGIHMHTAYRPDLHAALVELATAQDGQGPPVRIIDTCGVTVFDAEAGAVALSDGMSVSADVVVAADGIHSSAPSAVNGVHCPELEATGTVVHRFTLPASAILKDPETADLLRAGPDTNTFYVASDNTKWLLRYGCRDDGLQNFGLYSLRTHEGADGLEQRLRFETTKKALIEEMDGFHPNLLKLAAMADEVLPLWRCATREPLPRLTQGNLVVIGDAAHPVLPHIGLGAVMAIEDAAALGVLFKDIPDDADVNKTVKHGLGLFEKLRKPRVAVMKYYSDVPFFRDTVEEQRDRAQQYMSAEELPADRAGLGPWYMGYDVVAEAEQILRKCLSR